MAELSFKVDHHTVCFTITQNNYFCNLSIKTITNRLEPSFSTHSHRECRNSNLKTDNFAKLQRIRNLFVLGSHIPSHSLVRVTS